MARRVGQFLRPLNLKLKDFMRNKANKKIYSNWSLKKKLINKKFYLYNVPCVNLNYEHEKNERFNQ